MRIGGGFVGYVPVGNKVGWQSDELPLMTGDVNRMRNRSIQYLAFGCGTLPYSCWKTFQTKAVLVMQMWLGCYSYTKTNGQLWLERY